MKHQNQRMNEWSTIYLVQSQAWSQYASDCVVSGLLLLLCTAMSNYMYENWKLGYLFVSQFSSRWVSFKIKALFAFSLPSPASSMTENRQQTVHHLWSMSSTLCLHVYRSTLSKQILPVLLFYFNIAACRRHTQQHYTDEAVTGFTEIHVKYCVHPAMHCCSSDGVLVASVTQMLTGAANSVRWWATRCDAAGLLSLKRLDAVQSRLHLASNNGCHLLASKLSDDVDNHKRQPSRQSARAAVSLACLFPHSIRQHSKASDGKYCTRFGPSG